MKYDKQDQQRKAALNERNPHAKPSYRKKKINLKKQTIYFNDSTGFQVGILKLPDKSK
jgi:hypothetical protein